MSDETNITRKSKLNKKLLIGAVAVIALALVAALTLLLPKSAEAGKLSESLDLGDKYLSELNYEQAIVSYLEAIEIDPKNVDALVGLADAYLARGEYDKAAEILEDALAGLGGDAAETVQDKLEEVRAAKTAAEATPIPESTATPAPTATNTPVPTSTPEPTATLAPTETPTPEPTATSTPVPTNTPTPEPTATSTPIPTSTPTPTPTVTPTPLPTFIWKENEDGTLTLSRFNDKEATTVTVPEEVDGKKVTRINSAFSGKSNLTEVILPESITSIGISAFSNCSSLKKVNIPSGVTSIERWTFSDCSSLEEVIIPEGVTSIGQYAFNGCSSLTEIRLPKGITSLDNGTFEGCSSLTEITIPEGVTSIGWGVFEDCTNLKEIQLPDSLTKISYNAFENCASLETLHIPAGVKEIGSYSGNYANNISFNPGANFEAFTVADENEVFAAVNGSLYSKDMKYLLRVPCAEAGSYVVLETVESMAGGAFMNCGSITEIVIQSSKLQGLWAANDNFTGCNSLERFVVEASDSIYSTLDGMLMIDNKIQIVPNKAAGAEFSIPDTVTSIDAHAFSSCVELEKVYFPASVNAYHGGSHSHNGYTYDTSEQNYFKNCVSLKEIVVDSANEEYKSVDGVLFTADGTTLVSMPAKYSKTTYTVPEGVVNLGHYAFMNCNQLVKVILPNSLVTICPDAFADCTNLTNMVIPGNVKTIGVSAFSNCTSLTELVLPDSVTSIHDYAFSNCNQLASIVVPASVTELGDRVFDDSTTIITPSGSVAESYAIEEELTVQNP